MIVLRTENVVSIHPFLPFAGAVASLLTFGFCLGLVLYPLFHSYTGSLRYISEGMNDYAGWSGAILGSAGMFIALCELVAALHTSSQSLLVAVLIQAPAWCILIGVSGTGWGIHYTALVVFLLSTLYFHWVFASCHPMTGTFYQRTNLVALLNLFAFGVAFCASRAAQGPLSLDITVSLELTLMCCVTVQNLCVARVLHQYRSIHILFEPYP
jgi:hypothetical protein